MAKVQKPCRVCGKLYTPCNDCEKDKTVFHWRSIACSPKCAQIYLQHVYEARNPKPKTVEIKKENKTIDTKVIEKTQSKIKKVNKESEQID